ncbi:MAG: amino acid permease [Bacteroidetes bacterium]|nr:MAG: amino acid permease [Bacteroidota bacterium]
MAKPTHSHANIQTELSRDMGLSTILAIGVGTMIAAGIFTLSGLAIRNVGSGAILSFLLAAIVAVFTALTYCEFVSIYPNSGEGYLYARKTYPAPLAYFVGWALVLGYTSSCAFYIASLSSYFYEFIWETPFEALSGIVMLIGLTLLNIKGTKESGRFQVFVTLGKVALLIWFVFGGLGSVNVAGFIERFSTDIVKIGSTAAMVFITFFGFSAIAATAGEVKNPVKTIPRAIFLSMGIVTLLYILVVLVVDAAGLTEYTEAAMGVAATQFLGPIGGMVIIAGAIFSMVSASNASIIAGSRVSMAMSQLGHFPRAFGEINPRTKTPIVSVMLVGGTILIFAISLPLEDLAHFADTVLLLVLILVNAALIVHRYKYPHIERPFKVPLVPLMPALGILANFYLLSQIFHHTAPMLMAIACLVLGVLAFFAWKGSLAEESAIEGAPSRVAVGRYATHDSKFRILLPLANPKNVEALMQVAAAIARERDGEVIALRVAVIPDQAIPMDEDTYVQQEQEILDIAHRAAQKYEVPITSLLRIGHNAARAILETARERDCDLILMGWKGFPSTRQMILGEVTDAVVRHAKTDIMLVKLGRRKEMKRFLLPSAGGEHARKAGEYVASIVKNWGGTLTIGAVLNPETKETEANEVKENLNEMLARLSRESGTEVRSKIIEHQSVADGIIQASKDYDVVVVGATGYGYFKQILFGSIPETIARESDCTVILVKNYHPVKSLIGKVMVE